MDGRGSGFLRFETPHCTQSTGRNRILEKQNNSIFLTHFSDNTSPTSPVGIEIGIGIEQRPRRYFYWENGGGKISGSEPMPIPPVRCPSTPIAKQTFTSSSNTNPPKTAPVRHLDSVLPRRSVLTW